MGFLGKLLGGSGEAKQPKSARDAVALARQALSDWSSVQAASAQLCCVYTSGEDASREVTRDGRCRGWHVDFHLPNAHSFYIVRVLDGKTTGRERPASKNPVEYIYALYGSADKTRQFAEPIALLDEFADSPAIAKAAFAALDREMQGVDRGILDDYILLALCLPALYVRYLHPEWEPKLLAAVPPPQLCYAAILAHIDVNDHDALIVYVDAATGREAAVERFRFPAYVGLGASADW